MLSLLQVGYIPSLFSIIQGQGEVDENYYHTVNSMGILAKEEGALSQYQLGQYLTPEKLLGKNYLLRAD